MTLERMEYATKRIINLVTKLKNAGADIFPVMRELKKIENTAIYNVVMFELKEKGII